MQLLGRESCDGYWNQHVGDNWLYASKVSVWMSEWNCSIIRGTRGTVQGLIPSLSFVPRALRVCLLLFAFFCALVA